MHAAHWFFCLPWGQGLHSALWFFFLPLRQGLHSSQCLFLFPFPRCPEYGSFGFWVRSVVLFYGVLAATCDPAVYAENVG